MSDNVDMEVVNEEHSHNVKLVCDGMKGLLISSSILMKQMSEYLFSDTSDSKEVSEGDAE